MLDIAYSVIFYIFTISNAAFSAYLCGKFGFHGTDFLFGQFYFIYKMLTDRQIEAGGQLLARMQKQDEFNVDALGVLEFIGLDDISSDKVVDYLKDENLIRKDDGGYNITSKGQDVSDFAKYIRDKNARLSGDVASGRKASFDWKHRWINHPIIKSAISAIVGGIIGSIITYYVGKL